LPAGQPRTAITGGRSLFGAFARGHSRIDGCAVYNRHFERSSQPVRGRDPENFHKPELDSSCATAPIIPRRKSATQFRQSPSARVLAAVAATRPGWTLFAQAGFVGLQWPTAENPTIDRLCRRLGVILCVHRCERQTACPPGFAKRREQFYQAFSVTVAAAFRTNGLTCMSSSTSAN
jgi:hypothetical protein